MNEDANIVGARVEVVEDKGLMEPDDWLRVPLKGRGRRKTRGSGRFTVEPKSLNA